MMKKLRQIRIGVTCLFVILSMAIYSFQIGIARGDFEVSKRQDFATDDTTFHTNEDIYIKVGIDQVRRFHEGKARLKVLVRQDDRTKFRRIVPLVIQGDKTAVSYMDDIQPLFTRNGAWFNYGGLASFACGGCHAGDDGIPPEECPPECHLMNLGTRAGMLNGADGGSVPILGENSVGATDYDWAESTLRKRLRNNRMPPGWEFRLNESNRNGPDVSTTNDGNDLPLSGSDFFIKRDASGNYEYSCCDAPNPNAVGLVGTWVEGTSAGINDGNGTSYEGDTNVTWSDVAPFFTQQGAWYYGSLACAYCHAGDVNGDGEENCPNECHLMNLSSAAGLRGGSDSGEDPILGESSVGATNFNWGESELRKRLRNNRMPPTSPFVLDESNRDGRTLIHPVTGAPVSAVDLIGEWVDAGCPNN